MASTILIADDSAAIPVSLEAILGRGGFAAVKAVNGEDAFCKSQGGARPALMITDILTGRMNGSELINQVRAMAGFQFTPIPVVTSGSRRLKRDEARAAKATAWLVKPVQPDDLMKIVKHIRPKG